MQPGNYKQDVESSSITQPASAMQTGNYGYEPRPSQFTASTSNSNPVQNIRAAVCRGGTVVYLWEVLETETVAIADIEAEVDNRGGAECCNVSCVAWWRRVRKEGSITAQEFRRLNQFLLFTNVLWNGFAYGALWGISQACTRYHQGVIKKSTALACAMVATALLTAQTICICILALCKRNHALISSRGICSILFTILSLWLAAVLMIWFGLGPLGFYHRSAWVRSIGIGLSQTLTQGVLATILIRQYVVYLIFVVHACRPDMPQHLYLYTSAASVLFITATVVIFVILNVFHPIHSDIYLRAENMLATFPILLILYVLAVRCRGISPIYSDGSTNEIVTIVMVVAKVLNLILSQTVFSTTAYYITSTDVVPQLGGVFSHWYSTFFICSVTMTQLIGMLIIVSIFDLTINDDRDPGSWIATTCAENVTITAITREELPGTSLQVNIKPALSNQNGN